MKKWMYLSCLIWLTQTLVSQTPVDTVVTLNNIVVHGTHFAGLSGGEIKRLQVNNNLSSMTGTAAEALRQLPSLTTDIEGNLTFRGSNKTVLLLHGIPYGLLEEYSGDALIQLPALFFNEITINSYPPIEWMPDGDAGVLNFNSLYSAQNSPLQATLGIGWNDRYNIGAVANIHPGKFHITGKYNYRQEYRMRSFKKTTTNKAGTTEMNNNASARPDIHTADLLVGYEITPYDKVSVYGIYHLMDYSRYGGINNTRKNTAGEIINRMLRHRYNDQRQEAYAAEAQWNHKLNKHSLDVTLNYNNFSYDEDNDYKNENPLTETIVAQDNLFINQKKDNYYLSGVYQYRFANNILLKSGYTGRIKKEHYTSEANNLNAGNWIPNPQKTDDYTFRRFTNLLFVSMEKQWVDVVFEAGLQGELTQQKARETEHTSYHLYPRIRFSYLTNTSDAFTISYIQRVIRPLGAELNDFIDQSDATHIFRGNPDLKNEFIHSLDIAYTLNLPHLRVIPALYYRNRTHRIMEIAQITEERTLWQKENMDGSQLYGVELSASWTPVRNFSMSLSGNLFHDEIDGRGIGYDEKKDMICWDAKGVINLHITPHTELQIDGFLISDQLTPQGEIKRHYSVNAGISQYLLDRKLRVNLSMNNIFDSLEETTLVNTATVQMEQIRNRDARVSWLSLTYSL